MNLPWNIGDDHRFEIEPGSFRRARVEVQSLSAVAERRQIIYAFAHFSLDRQCNVTPLSDVIASPVPRLLGRGQLAKCVRFFVLLPSMRSEIEAIFRLDNAGKHFVAREGDHFAYCWINLPGHF